MGLNLRITSGKRHTSLERYRMLDLIEAFIQRYSLF